MATLHGSTRSSVGLGSPGRSKCRVRCTGSTFLVGNKEFLSASDALQAYIRNFDGLPSNSSTRYKQSPSELFSPKSSLHLTAERSLDTGVRDTEMELKLSEARESINDSYDKMKRSVELRKSVEDALNRSGELLERITKEETSPTCPSDIGSLNTDMLLTVNPFAGYKKDLGASTDSGYRRKHVYSYKTPRTRSQTLGSVTLSQEISNLRSELDSISKDTNPFNVENYKPDTSRSRRDQSGVAGERRDFSLPRPMQQTDGRVRERSRSVSPSVLQGNRTMGRSSRNPLPRWSQDNDSSKHKPPSWINSLDTTNVTDSLWSKRDPLGGRPPPSWIQDLEKSDITSVISMEPSHNIGLTDLVPPSHAADIANPTIDGTLDTNPPGLSFRDLVTESPQKKRPIPDSGDSRTSSRRHEGLGNSLYRNMNEQDFSEKNDIVGKSRRLLSPVGGDRLSSDIASSSSFPQSFPDDKEPWREDNPYSTKTMPRCSSLDTLTLLTGHTMPSRSDISGASPIPKDQNEVQNAALPVSTTPVSSPARNRRPQTPDTDLILDGDRPWEKSLASFKPPVYVDEDVVTRKPVRVSAFDGELEDTTIKTDTLTGRHQPGSLEALKNMLFKLQQEDSSRPSTQQARTNSLMADLQQLRSETGGPESVASYVSVEMPALKGYNFQGEPGGQSLERALVHLTRLKTLVDTGKNEQRQGVTTSSSRTRTLSGSTILSASNSRVGES